MLEQERVLFLLKITCSMASECVGGWGGEMVPPTLARNQSSHGETLPCWSPTLQPGLPRQCQGCRIIPLPLKSIPQKPCLMGHKSCGAATHRFPNFSSSWGHSWCFCGSPAPLSHSIAGMEGELSDRCHRAASALHGMWTPEGRAFGPPRTSLPAGS